MRNVTFLVLEGVDKGRVFRDLTIPVTIGREEGNALRLNDERVSRYHAKVQMEDGDIFDYLHRGLTNAVENIEANDDGTEVRLGFGEWQMIQAVQMLLARYGRTIADPDPK